MTIRVVLAEDHALLRQGLERLLAAADDIELVGTAADLPALEALIEAESTPTWWSPTSACRRPAPTRASGWRPGCAPSGPACGVVVLSQHAEAAYALALLADGLGRAGPTC